MHKVFIALVATSICALCACSDSGGGGNGPADAAQTDAGRSDAGRTDAGGNQPGRTDAGGRRDAGPGGEPEVSAEVGPEGATLESSDGYLTLTIPEGALAESTTITITKVDIEDLGSEWEGIDVGRAYDLGPDGLSFELPVTVAIRSDQEPLQDDGEIAAEAEELVASHGGEIEVLAAPQIELVEDVLMVRGETMRFSTFALTVVEETSRWRASVSGIPKRVQVGKPFNITATWSFASPRRDASARYLDSTFRSLHPTEPDSNMSKPLPAVSTTDFRRSFSYVCDEAGPADYAAVLFGETREKTLPDSFVARAVVDCFDAPKLTVTTSGSGAGSVNSLPEGIDCGEDCDERYDGGTSVFLTAVPDDGSVFAGWSGDCSGSSQAVEVVMDGDRACDARFEPETATTGTVAIHVRVGGAAAEGIPVVIQDGTGAAVTSLETDENGDATAAIAAGSMVTVLNTVLQTSRQVVTYQEVDPGDELVFDLSGPPGSVPVTLGSFQVTLPGAVTDATTYSIRNGCTEITTGNVASAHMLNVFSSCHGEQGANVFAQALNGSSVPLAWAHGPATPVSGGASVPLSLPAWNTSFVPLIGELTDTPAGISSAGFGFSFTVDGGPGGRAITVTPSRQLVLDPVAGSSVERSLLVPDSTLVTGATFSIYLYAEPGALDPAWTCTRRVAPPFDRATLSGAALPPLMSDAVFDPADPSRPSVSWTQTGSGSSDIVAWTYMGYWGATFGTWIVFAPGDGDRTSLQVPGLPAGAVFAPFDPASSTPYQDSSSVIRREFSQHANSKEAYAAADAAAPAGSFQCSTTLWLVP